jgi:hypothetical protein
MSMAPEGMLQTLKDGEGNAVGAASYLSSYISITSLASETRLPVVHRAGNLLAVFPLEARPPEAKTSHYSRY